VPSVGRSMTWMLGSTLSLRACKRGGRVCSSGWCSGTGSSTDTDTGSGSGSMSSKLGSSSMGENDPTVSSRVCVRVRFFLIETIGEWIGYCKAFLDLGAPTALFPERIVKTNGGLFARNSFALGPSWQGVVLVVADSRCG